MAQAGLTHILLISSKSVPNPRWQNNQIVLLKSNPHPLAAFNAAPNIEEPVSIKDVPDLFVLMQVLVEEHAHFFLVHIAHLLG